MPYGIAARTHDLETQYVAGRPLHVLLRRFYWAALFRTCEGAFLAAPLGPVRCKMPVCASEGRFRGQCPTGGGKQYREPLGANHRDRHLDAAVGDHRVARSCSHSGGGCRGGCGTRSRIRRRVAGTALVGTGIFLRDGGCCGRADGAGVDRGSEVGRRGGRVPRRRARVALNRLQPPSRPAAGGRSV